MAHIENKAQYQWALQKIEQLICLVDNNTPADDENMIELSLLSNLVSDYENVKYPIGKPSLADIIKLRMYEMNLTQQKLADILQVSQSRVSEYLNGKTEPTLKVAKVLHKKLNISAELILS